MQTTPLKVFITGASTGIGAALAHEYASQGAILGLVARREQLLTLLKQQLNTEQKLDVINLKISSLHEESMKLQTNLLKMAEKLKN